MDPLQPIILRSLNIENLSQGPNDILFKIFERLTSYQDVRNVSFVCKRFYNLLNRRDLKIFMINEVFKELKEKKLDTIEKYYDRANVAAVVQFCTMQNKLVSNDATPEQVEDAEWKLARVNRVYKASLNHNCCEKVITFSTALVCCLTVGCGGLGCIALAIYNSYTKGVCHPCPSAISEEEEVLLIQPRYFGL